jgi:hypothetical protein
MALHRAAGKMMMVRNQCGYRVFASEQLTTESVTVIQAMHPPLVHSCSWTPTCSGKSGGTHAGCDADLAQAQQNHETRPEASRRGADSPDPRHLHPFHLIKVVFDGNRLEGAGGLRPRLIE